MRSRRAEKIQRNYKFHQRKCSAAVRASSTCRHSRRRRRVKKYALTDYLISVHVGRADEGERTASQLQIIAAVVEVGPFGHEIVNLIPFSNSINAAPPCQTYLRTYLTYLVRRVIKWKVLSRGEAIFHAFHVSGASNRRAWPRAHSARSTSDGSALVICLSDEVHRGRAFISGSSVLVVLALPQHHRDVTTPHRRETRRTLREP